MKLIWLLLATLITITAFAEDLDDTEPERLGPGPCPVGEKGALGVPGRRPCFASVVKRAISAKLWRDKVGELIGMLMDRIRGAIVNRSIQFGSLIVNGKAIQVYTQSHYACPRRQFMPIETKSRRERPKQHVHLETLIGIREVLRKAGDRTLVEF